MIEELLLKERRDCVVYVGDGGGDYCPCTKLGSMDVILARSSYTGITISCLFGKNVRDERTAFLYFYHE